MLFEVAYIAFSVWALFLGGAAKLEDSFLGYLSFSKYPDKERFVKGHV